MGGAKKMRGLKSGLSCQVDISVGANNQYNDKYKRKPIINDCKYQSNNCIWRKHYKSKVLVHMQKEIQIQIQLQIQAQLWSQLYV